MTEIECNEISEIVNKCVTETLLKLMGGCLLHNDDTMSKVINGEVIRKQSVGRKDWSHDWIENVKVEDIDTRFFNLDYSRIIK